MNQWVDPNGDTVPNDWAPGLPPNGEWQDGCGCEPPGGAASVSGITITGVPATVSSLYWQVSLNDGSSPPNFQINQLDGKGAFVSTAAEITPSMIYFDYPVLLSRDPVEPMEAVTLEYLEAHETGIPEPPDNQTYGRALGAWNLVVPQSGGTYTGAVSLGAGGAVTSGALQFFGSAAAYFPALAQLQIGDGPAGQVPTADGSGNLTWTTPVTGGPYLPIAGGTVTGSLTVNQVLTVQGSNSMVLNAPVTGGSQRTILGMAANVARWGLTLGDGTAEGANNVGANFSLAGYGVTGAFLGTWLSIARADGSTVFNGSGVTIQGGLAVNGLLALASPNNLAIYGGTPGQFLSTNGSGVLSWASAAGGGASITVSDTPPSAPSVGALWWDSVGGQLYVYYSDANSSQWVPASNAASLPPPASTTVLGSVKVDGTSIKAAADGTISTVLIPMGDNRLINGDMRIDQRWNGAAEAGVNTYTVDRWFYGATQGAKGTWGRSSASGLNPFPYCLCFTSSSAYAVVAGDSFNFQQRIEADLVSDFAFGTLQAQAVTLSFWAYSSLTGTFSGALGNNPAGSTRSYPFTFSLPTANTWTRIIITVPGDTSGAWTMLGSGAGFLLTFDLGTGATYRGPANAWASANYIGANGAVSVVSTNGATFYVTGVKLEIGSVATPFNRQSLAKSMADCQRYFANSQAVQLSAYVTAGLTFGQSVTFPVTMRVAPTITLVGPTYSNASGAAVTTNSLGAVTVYATGAAAGLGSFTISSLQLSAEL
jgi:hypothetical protein